MSLFRKEKPKAEEPVEKEALSEEEMTDISEVAEEEAISSASSDKPSKMEEIFSTKEKQVKYKNLTPIEAEQAQKRREEAKRELIDGKMEFAPEEEEELPEIELKAEISEDTVVSDDIIEEVRGLKNLRGIYVQDIDDIDISLDPEENIRQYEKKANDHERFDKRREEKPSSDFGFSEKIVSKVPVYRREADINKIPLKAGRFTDVVESEYDEYLKSDDPTVSKNYHAMYQQLSPKQSLLITLSQMATKHKEELSKLREERALQKQEKKELPENFDEEEEPKEKKENAFLKFFRVLFTVIGQSFLLSGGNRTEETRDFESREDIRYAEEQLKKNRRKLTLSLILTGVFTALLLWLAVIERIDLELTFTGFIDEGPLLYGITNLILLIGGGIAARSYLINGIKPLRRFKGNCDTLASLAYFACLIQNIIALFIPTRFAGGDNHLYSFIPLFALFLNIMGRLMTAYRVKDNLGFISSQLPAYSAKIYNDDETARRMLNGTSTSKGSIVYQHITSFLSDFLKISYAPDPNEEISGKITPVTVVASVFVAIAYAFIFKDAVGVFSALSVMLCISIPFCAMVAGNLPLLMFSKSMKKHGAMVAGYPSVRQFSDTGAFMVKASELFPKGCVKLKALNATQQYRVEESLISAAMVLKEASSPLSSVFDELIEEYAGVLPSVESVMYEDKCGLVGWVSGERILIGNMHLMDRYHITVPEKARHIKDNTALTTYIAVAGRLCCVALVSYKAHPQLYAALQKTQKNGLSILVSTTDVNVTAELVSEQYKLFYRSVRVLPVGYSSVVEEVTSKSEDTSRAYVATRGKFSSLIRAVSGCIGLRSNLTLGIVVSIFGLFLGVLLCATLVLYATVDRLSIIEMIIYIMFWFAATLLSELVRRP